MIRFCDLPQRTKEKLTGIKNVNYDQCNAAFITNTLMTKQNWCITTQNSSRKTPEESRIPQHIKFVTKETDTTIHPHPPSGGTIEGDASSLTTFSCIIPTLKLSQSILSLVFRFSGISQRNLSHTVYKIPKVNYLYCITKDCIYLMKTIFESISFVFCHEPAKQRSWF